MGDAERAVLAALEAAPVVLAVVVVVVVVVVAAAETCFQASGLGLGGLGLAVGLASAVGFVETMGALLLRPPRLRATPRSCTQSS